MSKGCSPWRTSRQAGQYSSPQGYWALVPWPFSIEKYSPCDIQGWEHGSARAHRLSLCEAPGSIRAQPRISISASHWQCAKMVAFSFFWLAHSPASNSVFSFRFKLQLCSDCYRRPCSGVSLPGTLLQMWTMSGRRL